jgi:hypothetical protein
MMLRQMLLDRFRAVDARARLGLTILPGLCLVLFGDSEATR